MDVPARRKAVHDGRNVHVVRNDPASSLFKQFTIEPTLPNNGQQRPSLQLMVLRDWNSPGAFRSTLLHNHVTAALSHSMKPMLLKNSANVTS